MPFNFHFLFFHSYLLQGKQFFTTPITASLTENENDLEGKKSILHLFSFFIIIFISIYPFFIIIYLLGSIIVENNFRLYAYANSYSNFIPVISLFADQLFELPNMIIFHITRSTVIQCFNLGVSATHINSFISRNIHPKVSLLCEQINE